MEGTGDQEEREASKGGLTHGASARSKGCRTQSSRRAAALGFLADAQSRG
jgi:hypothetical protein